MIVGADELDKNSQAFWRILASLISGQQADLPKSTVLEPTTPQKDKFFVGEYHDMAGLLDRLAEIIQQMLLCDALWIGIKHGEVLTIEKIWNGADWLEKSDIQPEEAVNIFSLLRSGFTTREANSPGWSLLPKAITATQSRYWVGLPIMNGQTTIGLISIFGPKRYLQYDLEKIERLTQHVSSALYAEIEQMEINRQLACLNRFNDIVLAATQGDNLQDVARKLVRLLSESIQTPLVGLLMPTADRKYLHQYGAEPLKAESVFPVCDTLAGHVFETGIPVQIRDARREIISYKVTPGIISELAVPLIYRGTVTGVLDVESPRANAFNRNDVEFLTLVAGYMAGFLEFLHLQQATEVRASNLSLIYNLVQKIGGLSDIQEITKISAELLAEHFIDSRVEIAVVEDVYLSKTTTAFAGNLTLDTEEIPLKPGALEYIKQYNQSHLIDAELSSANSYPWDSKQRFAHQILLPIRKDDNFLGLISVTSLTKQKFSYNDILVVEVVTGVLSGHLPFIIQMNC
ncbi:MAG: GAF domain-containing protein [Anaerolineaceae bacterium]|nr:GAF domain-containing protein [Anaerolineaceae bacterium]